ncbi:hypothetical protein LCGC14_1177390 [marine sediment metagenome]|uniref:Uncharacterized protein n=1 Tax=marine sediment metagenome TaxID=412755 RepID=A0A0F9LN69_9ZZZZ
MPDLEFVERMLGKKWEAVPCPCGQSLCHAGMIEPYVVSGQGVMEMGIAEHIVELHNASLERSTHGRPTSRPLQSNY